MKMGRAQTDVLPLLQQDVTNKNQQWELLNIAYSQILVG